MPIRYNEGMTTIHTTRAASMTTAEYRDELNSLRDAIDGFKACVNYEERERAADRLQRNWRHMALLEQPKRLPKAEVDRCQRFLSQSAAVLNNWLIEVESGAKDAVEVHAAPPEQAMKDTMRFCATAKRYGF